MEKLTLERAEQLQAQLAGLFDEVRIVEAESGRACAFAQGRLLPAGQQRRTPAHGQCAAAEACRTGQRRVKLEYAGGRYYFVVAQPVSIAGGLYALELVTDITSRTITDEGLAAPENFVQAMSHQLEAISEQEAFTGLYSKSYLERRLQAQLASAGQKPLYLCVFDIDEFHSINAYYGHVQGDAVLLKFAELLRQALGGRAGYAARFDGDEFALVLENATGEECAALMRRIQQAFADHLFCVAEMKFHARASAGLADVSGAASFAQALELARAARRADGKSGG